MIHGIFFAIGVLVVILISLVVLYEISILYINWSKTKLPIWWSNFKFLVTGKTTIDLESWVNMINTKPGLKEHWMGRKYFKRYVYKKAVRMIEKKNKKMNEK